MLTPLRKTWVCNCFSKKVIWLEYGHAFDGPHPPSLQCMEFRKTLSTVRSPCKAPNRIRYKIFPPITRNYLKQSSHELNQRGSSELQLVPHLGVYGCAVRLAEYTARDRRGESRRDSSLLDDPINVGHK